MKAFENIEIINQAFSILKNDYAFQKSTMYLQSSFFEGVSEEDYAKIDYKLKAIRQDFTKILVIMNCIDRTYSAYQLNEYTPSYTSVMDNQATNELGCFIEYLFAKYRVILEYIQQILELCIPPRLNDIQKKEYDTLKKAHTKYKFLLKYIAENIGKTSSVLNMEWFQNIRIDRDFIMYSSDLLRAKHTAEIVGKHLEITPILSTELRERNLGRCVGKSVKWMKDNIECQEKSIDDKMFSDAESRRDE